MRARLGRSRAGDDRRRIDRALPARALLGELGCAAGGAEAAAEILRLPARCAGLVEDRFDAIGPVGRLCHQTRSRNMLTWDDSTPPSPCSSAIDASRTWRLPARPVICKWVSTRCAMAPPTPQWP